MYVVLFKKLFLCQQIIVCSFFGPGLLWLHTSFLIFEFIASEENEIQERLTQSTVQSVEFISSVSHSVLLS